MIQKNLRKKKPFIPVKIGELPKPHPPKFWTPSPDELARNPFLMDAMPDLVKAYNLDKK